MWLRLSLLMPYPTEFPFRLSNPFRFGAGYGGDLFQPPSNTRHSLLLPVVGLLPYHLIPQLRSTCRLSSRRNVSSLLPQTFQKFPEGCPGSLYRSNCRPSFARTLSDPCSPSL